MQCGDLERYLEAFLDGRLGRSRSAILRRHLALCGGCRARVERLRQFERDMQRRFRSMDPDQSIWRGLELDLVAASRGGSGPLLALPRLLPPQGQPAGEGGQGPGPRRGHPILASRPGAKSRASRLAGVVLIAMALGSLYQLARTYLAPAEEMEATARAYAALRSREHELALSSDDARQLEAWLAAELGVPVALPPTPTGYRPLGADRATLASGEAGAVVYADSHGVPGAALVLFVEPLPAGDAPAPSEEAADGLHELSWSHAALRYTLVGDRPVEELVRP